MRKQKQDYKKTNSSMEEEKEYNSKYEELANVLVDITITAITKQKTNTTANYPVTMEDGYDMEITIRKEEDKWEILLVDDKWKTIKRSNKEAEEILLTITQIVIELTKIIRQIKQHNEQLKQINN